MTLFNDQWLKKNIFILAGFGFVHLGIGELYITELFGFGGLQEIRSRACSVKLIHV